MRTRVSCLYCDAIDYSRRRLAAKQRQLRRGSKQHLQWIILRRVASFLVRCMTDSRRDKSWCFATVDRFVGLVSLV